MKSKTKSEYYKSEFCEMLIQHMSQGLSYESFGAVVKCGRTTLYDWERKHPEWVKAKQEGTSVALKFWESLLAAKAFGSKKEIDITAVIFCLKTRFHQTYGEHQKVQLSGEITTKSETDLSALSDAELRTVQKIMAKHKKGEEE